MVMPLVMVARWFVCVGCSVVQDLCEVHWFCKIYVVVMFGCNLNVKLKLL